MHSNPSEAIDSIYGAGTSCNDVIDNIGMSPRTVLITGCSDGGMGSALAEQFHRAGYNVIATARDTSKVNLSGVKVLALDITSEESFAGCVKQLDRLDILVNNAGLIRNMPITDLSITDSKKLFDTNVWAQIAMIQACIPLLKESKGIVVNHTSIAAVLPLPFQGLYAASKAAFSMMSDTMKMELRPFDIKVVNLKTGIVKTNIINNMEGWKLPATSIFGPVRKEVETVMNSESVQANGMPAAQWAKEVVVELSKKNPPAQIWKGESATLGYYASVLFPTSLQEWIVYKTMGIDKVEDALREHKSKA